MNIGYKAETDLHKLVSLTREDNEIITEIKASEKEAVDTKKQAETENVDFNARVAEIDENVKGLLGFNESIIKIGKDYINVIDTNKLPFDMPSITQAAKIIVENEEAEKKDLLNKIEDNTKAIEEAKNIISEAPLRLKQEETIRKELKTLLDRALSGADDVDKRRIRETLSKLNVFSEEEIEAMLLPIMFPEQGLKAAVESFVEKGKTTSDMVKDALEFGAKKVAKKPASTVKKTSMTKAATKAFDLDAHLNAARNTKKEEPKKSDEPKKVVKTEKVVKESIEDFLKQNLDVTDEDIKFTPAILNMSLGEVKEAIKLCQENGIDPKEVSLKEFVNGIKKLVENVKTIKKYGYEVNDMLIAKNPYLTVIPNERVSNDLELLAQRGMSLVRYTGNPALIVVSRETNKLESAIHLIETIDENYFRIDPVNMAKIIGGPAARMNYCQENGINYIKADGTVESFIESAKEFKELFGIDIDSKYLPSAKKCNEALIEMVENPDVVMALSDFWKSGKYLESIELDQEQMERFMKIFNNIKAKSTVASNSVVVIAGKKFGIFNIQKNLSWLISKKIEASDNDLINASMWYGEHKNPESIKEVNIALDPNTVSMSLAA